MHANRDCETGCPRRRTRNSSRPAGKTLARRSRVGAGAIRFAPDPGTRERRSKRPPNYQGLVSSSGLDVPSCVARAVNWCLSFPQTKCDARHELQHGQNRDKAHCNTKASVCALSGDQIHTEPEECEKYRREKNQKSRVGHSHGSNSVSRISCCWTDTATAFIPLTERMTRVPGSGAERMAPPSAPERSPTRMREYQNHSLIGRRG